MAYRKMLNMVRRGGLPAEKPRKEWRVRRTEVEAFIERSRVKPGEVKAAPGRP
jgi:excisionase family DNA binding protein